MKTPINLGHALQAAETHGGHFLDCMKPAQPESKTPFQEFRETQAERIANMEHQRRELAAALSNALTWMEAYKAFNKIPDGGPLDTDIKQARIILGSAQS